MKEPSEMSCDEWYKWYLKTSADMAKEIRGRMVKRGTCRKGSIQKPNRLLTLPKPHNA